MRAIRTIIDGIYRPVLEAKIGRTQVHVLHIEWDGIRVKRIPKETHFNICRPLISATPTSVVVKQFKRIARRRGATKAAQELLRGAA